DEEVVSTNKQLSEVVFELLEQREKHGKIRQKINEASEISGDVDTIRMLKEHVDDSKKEIDISNMLILELEKQNERLIWENTCIKSRLNRNRSFEKNVKAEK